MMSLTIRAFCGVCQHYTHGRVVWHGVEQDVCGKMLFAEGYSSSC